MMVVCRKPIRAYVSGGFYGWICVFYSVCVFSIIYNNKGAKMTVRELIASLEKIENKNLPVSAQMNYKDDNSDIGLCRGQNDNLYVSIRTA